MLTPLTLRTASATLVPPCSTMVARGTTTTLCGRLANGVPVLSTDTTVCSGTIVPLGPVPVPDAACAGSVLAATAPAPAARGVRATFGFGLGAVTTISGTVAEGVTAACLIVCLISCALIFRTAPSPMSIASAETAASLRNAYRRDLNLLLLPPDTNAPTPSLEP